MNSFREFLGTPIIVLLYIYMFFTFLALGVMLTGMFLLMLIGNLIMGDINWNNKTIFGKKDVKNVSE